MVEAFAQAHGLTVRSARNHRRHPKTGQPSAQWQAWVEKSRRGPCINGVESTEDTQKKAAQVSRARAIEADSWRLVSQLRTAMDTAAPAELPVLVRAYADARKNWEQARAYAIEQETAAGLLIPVERLRDIQRTLVGKLGNALRAWPNNIALRLPPELLPHFYAAEREERVKLRKAISAVDAALERLISLPC